MAKAREYECPKCGEFEEVVNDNFDGSIDIAERDGETYEYVAIVRKCYKCGHKWTEYMRLVYDGYHDGGKVYNAEGVEE